jgi:hypothetical protein
LQLLSRQTRKQLVAKGKSRASGMKTGGIYPARISRLRRYARALRYLLGCSALACVPSTAFAQMDFGLPARPRTNMGSVGLVEMPSARMAPDGELSIGAAYFQSNQRYNLGFQILPWLEGTFRYSGVQHFDPAYPVYWDRSFGLKLRLWDETDLLPALAVGINDIVGTGLYSGEYVVLSKQFGPVDASLGIGWGRFGSANTFRNPLAQIKSSFATRPSLTTPGGTNFNVYFHGPTAGVFGGLAWKTPISGLTAIVEASSDNYPFERVATTFVGQNKGFFPKTQINYGLSYEVTNNIVLGLNWLYGRSIGANFSLQLDPTTPQYPATLDPPPLPPTIRNDEEQLAALQGLQNPARRGVTNAMAQLRSNFVDALLVNDVTDVRMEGATLIVSLSGQASPARCAQIVQTARSLGGGIGSVVLRPASGPVQSCLAGGAPEGMLQPIAQNFVMTVATPSITIDARTPPTANRAAAMRNFRSAVTSQSITIVAAAFDDNTATVYYNNQHYLRERDAIERLTLILMKEAPTSIERFRLISMSEGMLQKEFTILRAPVERSYSQNHFNPSVFDGAISMAAPPPSNPILAAAERGSYPRFEWSLFPQFRQQFFDPNNPFGVQVLAGAYGSLELTRGLTINALAEFSFFDTFETARLSNSVLPHVRTDFVRYFSEGKNGIDTLDAEYRFNATPNFFVALRAGYLESMFAGVGGEVLWRPRGLRWALGADLYAVQQREFDRLLGLQNYNQITGHITLYYASPWYNLDLQLRAGQYLAGDRGLTVQVTRRFSTGVEIGAFMTKTNVSAARFGEGSFDKGIVIRIPLGWAAPIGTQSVLAMDLRPVQRDGGQVLAGDARLFEETRRASEAELLRTGATFAR